MVTSLFSRKQLCPQDSLTPYVPFFILNSNFVVSLAHSLVETNTLIESDLDHFFCLSAYVLSA